MDDTLTVLHMVSAALDENDGGKLAREYVDSQLLRNKQQQKAPYWCKECGWEDNGKCTRMSSCVRDDDMNDDTKQLLDWALCYMLANCDDETVTEMFEKHTGSSNPEDWAVAVTGIQGQLRSTT